MHKGEGRRFPFGGVSSISQEKGLEIFFAIFVLKAKMESDSPVLSLNTWMSQV